MPAAEECIYIRFFDSPQVMWRGTTLHVRPPLAFQVLAATALAPDRKSTRPKLAATLFTHLPSGQRASQLRLAVKKLKTLLDEASISSAIEITDTQVSIVPPCQTDLDGMLADAPISLSELAPFCKPVMVGGASRFCEIVRSRTKNWLEANVEQLYPKMTSVAESRTFQACLQELRCVYPHSVIICAYLCAILKNLNFIEEFTREIVAFEVDWVDAYGATDKPDISCLVDRILSGSKLQTSTSPKDSIIHLDSKLRSDQGAVS